MDPVISIDNEIKINQYSSVDHISLTLFIDILAYVDHSNAICHLKLIPGFRSHQYKAKPLDIDTISMFIVD